MRIYVPRGNSTEKNAAMRALGAELVEHGDDFQAAREEAMRVAAESGLVAVPAFHRDLVLGVATYALELLAAHPDLDVLYVPIGQGSGICGCIAARDALGLKTEIVGVQASGAPAYALSFAAGRAVATDSCDTLADGVATRVPDEEALAVIRRGAARIVLVDDDEIAAAIRAYWTDTHNLAEGAGAAPLAAALQGARPTRRQDGRPRPLRRQHRPRLFQRWAAPAVRPAPTLKNSRPRRRADTKGCVMTKIETKPEPEYPPSPYSSPIGKSNIESHTLSVLVDNEPGVLARVVGLFSARSFNIESLTVAEVAHETHQSRITIVTSGTLEVVEQVRHQLERLVPVHSVTDLTETARAIERELAMVKVRGKGDPRLEALQLAEAFRAKVIDATTESFIFEITGAPRKIDDFVDLMRPIGLVEVSRTGVAAISRGPKGI